MTREQQLLTWLADVLPQKTISLTTASADASFRRYFRVHVEGESNTMIVMDAPPSHEDCVPFINVDLLLVEAGLNVPVIHAKNLDQGFLLLSDLGNDTYLTVLNDQNASNLYRDACAALIKMQLATDKANLPKYDETLLLKELMLFPEWYLGQHLKIELSETQRGVLERTFTLLVQSAVKQPQVIVHRDYHSRNLMLTSEDNPGVLDFQDAVIGAITYDLVSLFKDAYIQWEEDIVMDWLVRYWQSAKKQGLPVNEDFGEFYKEYEWMGVQRHIKVLGIFARLFHRDGKSGYLNDMPLVLDYLKKACERYVELRPMYRLLMELDALQANSVIK